MWGETVGKLTFRGEGGSVSVTMDDRLDRLVRDAIEKTNPNTISRLEAAAEATFNNAKKHWPYGTKKRWGLPPALWRSRNRLHEEVRLKGENVIQAVVSNSAPYAYFIKANKLRGANPYRALIVKYGRSYVRNTMVPAMLEDMAKSVGGD